MHHSSQQSVYTNQISTHGTESSRHRARRSGHAGWERKTPLVWICSIGLLPASLRESAGVRNNSPTLPILQTQNPIQNNICNAIVDCFVQYAAGACVYKQKQPGVFWCVEKAKKYPALCSQRKKKTGK